MVVYISIPYKGYFYYTKKARIPSIQSPGEGDTDTDTEDPWG